MSKLSKFDIWIATSAILIKKRNIFFCKNKYHNAVNHVPNFQLSARSSSFFDAIFSSLLWSNFFWDTQYWMWPHRWLSHGFVHVFHRTDSSSGFKKYLGRTNGGSEGRTESQRDGRKDMTFSKVAWSGNEETRPDTRHKMRLVRVLFTFGNNTGRTDGRTDGPTDRYDLL